MRFFQARINSFSFGNENATSWCTLAISTAFCVIPIPNESWNRISSILVYLYSIYGNKCLVPFMAITVIESILMTFTFEFRLFWFLFVNQDKRESINNIIFHASMNPEKIFQYFPLKICISLKNIIVLYTTVYTVQVWGTGMVYNTYAVRWAVH